MAIEAAFIGTLGRAAELKTSTRGDQFVKMSVAVNEGDGTMWINVTAFDEAAIAAASALAKGAKVYCEGRLRPSEYVATDGTKRLGLSLHASYCRPAEIGRARRKRARTKRPAPMHQQSTVSGVPEFSDTIPWIP
jgi:single-stranded DNA-binding protein